MQIPGSTLEKSLGQSPGNLHLLSAPGDFYALESLKTTSSKRGAQTMGIGIIRAC